VGNEFVVLRKKLWQDTRVIIMAHKLADVLFPDHDSKLSKAVVTSVTKSAVIGWLALLWSLGEANIRDDDELAGFTPAMLDKEAGLPGFTSLLPPDWFAEKDGKVFLPGFRARLQDLDKKNNQRKEKDRLRQARLRAQRKASRDMSRDMSRDSHATREKKGSSPSSSPPTPPSTTPSLSQEKRTLLDRVKIQEVERSFTRFWDLFPKKVSKPTALRAWKKIAPDDTLLQQILAGLERHKHSEQWLRDDGQFIPYPATWLNARRWEDRLEVDLDGKPKANQNHVGSHSRLRAEPGKYDNIPEIVCGEAPLPRGAPAAAPNRSATGYVQDRTLFD
jgi:hypothetical protein